MSEARVSVVTPFYNTADFLAECIESVLGQTHGNFEYILCDNKSTDGSLEIARSYAQKDPRVRVVQNTDFVPQLQNYNGAFRQIGEGSKYVKLASADDVLYPECVAQLVAVAEQHPRVGLVGSYYVSEEGPAGGGVPVFQSVVPGREMCRRMLLKGSFAVGTPTTVLYRADLVRARPEFYPVDSYHGDTEVCYELMLEHDFGFVHQVLSFVRTDDQSITGRRQAFHPNLLDLLVVVERYGPKVFEAEELKQRREQVRNEYFGFLGRALLRGKGEDFWRYHRGALARLGEELSFVELLPFSLKEAALLALSPGVALPRAFSDLRSRYQRWRA